MPVVARTEAATTATTMSRFVRDIIGILSPLVLVDGDTSVKGINDNPLGAAAYAFTRSPDAADLSMAAMTSWRRTASAKSGTVCVPLSMSAANAA